jgi:hypothetical protein
MEDRPAFSGTRRTFRHRKARSHVGGVVGQLLSGIEPDDDDDCESEGPRYKTSTSEAAAQLRSAKAPTGRSAISSAWASSTSASLTPSNVTLVL